jgi:hypothetical protein
MFNYATGNGNGVEPNKRRVGSGPANVIARRASQGLNLLGIYSSFRGTPFAGGAGLYLDEHKGFLVPGDNIDFAATLRRAPVPGCEDEPLSPKITVREVFSPSAQIPLFAIAQAVSETVEASQRVQIQTPLPFPV